MDDRERVCPYCGAEEDPGREVCPHCGRSLPPPADPAVPAAGPAPVPAAAKVNGPGVAGFVLGALSLLCAALAMALSSGVEEGSLGEAIAAIVLLSVAAIPFFASVVLSVAGLCLSAAGIRRRHRRRGNAFAYGGLGCGAAALLLDAAFFLLLVL